MTIGSECACGVNNVLVSKCIFYFCDLEPMRLKGIFARNIAKLVVNGVIIEGDAGDEYDISGVDEVEGI